MSDYFDVSRIAFRNTHRIIWLDAFIGEENTCQEFKRRFCTTIDPDSPIGDPINICIATLHESAVPFIFVPTPEIALEEIERNRDKRVIFITSGSLGANVIPHISRLYPNVYKFYIFCQQSERYNDLVLDYIGILESFVHELDLLVRLARDLSTELIEKGRELLELNEPEDALPYFWVSVRLETTVNQQDKLNIPCLTNLRKLQGHQGNVGLIQEAEDRIAEQRRDHDSRTSNIIINETKGETESMNQ